MISGVITKPIQNGKVTPTSFTLSKQIWIKALQRVVQNAADLASALGRITGMTKHAS